MSPLSDRQLDIAAARKILGMVGRNYSDEDIQQALDCLYGLVEIGYQFHLEDVVRERKSVRLRF